MESEIFILQYVESEKVHSNSFGLLCPFVYLQTWESWVTHGKVNLKTERLREKTESLKWTGEKVKEKCRLTGSWFGFQVPRRRGGAEAGPGRRRRPGKGDKKVFVHSYSIFSCLASEKYRNDSYTVSQERSQPIITPIRDFFSWTFVSQP